MPSALPELVQTTQGGLFQALRLHRRDHLVIRGGHDIRRVGCRCPGEVQWRVGGCYHLKKRKREVESRAIVEDMQYVVDKVGEMYHFQMKQF